MDHKEARRRKYGKGLTSEYYLRTGIPLEVQRQRDHAQAKAIRAAILSEDKDSNVSNKGESDDPYEIIFE